MEMNKNDIEAIKSMQNHPKYHLANYFSDLKREVDLIFNSIKLNEKDNYLEIINKIELFEQECYKIKPFNLFNEENNLNIDEIKYGIEKMLFSNKSIMFIKDYGGITTTNKKFLLIINDEYLRKSTLDDIEKYDNDEIDQDDEGIELKYLNREKLVAYFLKEKLNESNITTTTNILSLDIEIEKKNSFKRWTSTIESIDDKTFNDLIYLKFIYITNNQINKIESNLFNGLINLEEICFKYNQNYDLIKNIK